MAVKTYIAGQDGKYHFNALSPNVDYEVLRRAPGQEERYQDFELVRFAQDREHQPENQGIELRNSPCAKNPIRRVKWCHKIRTGDPADAATAEGPLRAPRTTARTRFNTGPATDSSRGQRPGYGQEPEEPKKQAPPSPAQQVGNIKADVIWALKNAGGGMSVFDIGSKITAAGKPRYAETKIAHVLDMLVQDGKVSKGESTGRVTYKWAVEAF